MRVGAGLIRDHVAVFHVGHQARDEGKETLGLRRKSVLPAGGKMADPGYTHTIDDVVGAVAVVPVKVQNADAFGLAASNAEPWQRPLGH